VDVRDPNGNLVYKEVDKQLLPRVICRALGYGGGRQKHFPMLGDVSSSANSVTGSGAGGPGAGNSNNSTHAELAADWVCTGKERSPLDCHFSTTRYPFAGKVLPPAKAIAGGRWAAKVSVTEARPEALPQPTWQGVCLSASRFRACTACFVDVRVPLPLLTQQLHVWRMF